MDIEAERDALRAEVEQLIQTQAEELGTNLRIAERIGIWSAIEAGKTYEDAEVELFDRLRAEVERLKAEIKEATIRAVGRKGLRHG